MTLILALDQSTSATKALLFTNTGQLLDQVALPHEQIYPRPGWVEHNADEIYRNTMQAVGLLLERNPGAKDNLLCLSLTNQRETVVVFDRETGRPLHNAIVWQCRRGEPLCRQLMEAGHGSLVHECTGLRLDTYFPASKIAWLLNERPILRQRVETGSALIGTMDAYLIYRLTGGRDFATDHTNASRTLLYNISHLDWDGDLCDLFQIPLSSLPALRESRDIFGTTTFDGLLPRPLPICGVIGDSQAALFAQRCFERGNAKVTFGTGSSILLTLGSDRKVSEQGTVTALGWVLAGRPTYALEGITNFTGATIQWLRDQLQLIRTVDETEALAESVADNGGVYLVPAFVGLSAPYWRPNARAGILGLTPGASRAHVVRAGLESIAYIVNDALQLMGREAGLNLAMIYADGGAVRNRFLMQFVADITQLTVRASNLPELSALGAALFGALGMGLYGSLEDLQVLPSSYVAYTPLMDPSRTGELCAGWRQAVEQILSTS